MEATENWHKNNDFITANKRDMLDRMQGHDVLLELMELAIKADNEVKKKKLLEWLDKLLKSSDMYDRVFFENLALKERLRKMFAENQELANEVIRLKEEIDFIK